MALTDVQFDAAFLRGANFTGASFHGQTQFSNALAFAVNWGGDTPTPPSGVIDWGQGIDLSHLNLSGWNLTGLDFNGINLSGISLRWANLTGAMLSGATFNNQTDWTGSIWREVTLPSGTLAGIFRNVDFSGFTFSADLNWSLEGIDFAGVQLSGATGVHHFLNRLYTAWSAFESPQPKLDFSWADFSGLNLSGTENASTFQLGEFRGVSFKDVRLPDLNVDWDFSSLNLSLGDWSGFRLEGTSTLKLEGAVITAANLADVVEFIGSAAGALYDGFTSFGAATAELIAGLNMKEAVLEDVFGSPLTGPMFSIQPVFDIRGSEVILGLRLISNLDIINTLDFSLSLGEVLNLSAVGLSRFVLALDLEAGMAVATGSGSTPVGELPLPLVEDSDIFFRLNRLDTGVLIDLFDIQASLQPGSFANASLEEGGLTLKVAASIFAEDPDNTDGKGRITRQDLQRVDSVRDIFTFAPAMSLEGAFLLGGDLGDFSTSAWGKPLLTITSSIQEGQFVPDYYFDVSIGADSVRNHLTGLLASVASVGAWLDDSAFLAGRLPFVEASLGDILQSDDGRMLGDLLSFQRIIGYDTNDHPIKVSVLDDYYAKASAEGFIPTYSGLVQQLKDYLAAEGDYSQLQSLFPKQQGEISQGPFTVGGGFYLADQKEIQQITLTEVTAGTFTLSLTQGGHTYTTAAIAHDAVAAEIQAALRATLYPFFGLDSDEFAEDQLSVEGENGTYQVTFAGIWQHVNLAQLRIHTSADFAGQARVTTLQQGGQQGLALDLLLNLTQDVSLPFTLGSGLDAIGFALKGGGTLDLSAEVVLDLSFGVNFTDFSDLSSANVFFQARDISAQAAANLNNFTAGIALGVLDATIDKGTLNFVADAGVVINQGQQLTTFDSVGDVIETRASVWAAADFPIKANLFGGDLTKLTGGENPAVKVYWGDQNDPIPLSDLALVSPVIIKENFTNLASLTNMTPAMMVQMLVNIGDFLNQFRDSGVFDIPLPFTGYDLGDAFDFSYGWTQVLNQQLQGILSFDLTAENQVSPRLNDNLAFDLYLQRPGDLRPSAYTVTLFQADTAAFTHIDQLADYISERIAQATNGALQLQSSLPVWVTENQLIDHTQNQTNTDLSPAVTGTAATVIEDQKGGVPVNAVLLLDLSTATGDLSIQYKGGTAQLTTITAVDSDLEIIAKLTQRFASLVNTSAANILVSGSRAEGFRIEFAGNLVGRGYTSADFTLAISVPADATSAVTLTREATEGISEIKLLGFTGYASGTFELQFMGQKTGPIRYISDPLVQAQMIQQALETITGIGNVSVTFPTKDPLDSSGQKNNFGSAPKFLIEFKGALAKRDVPNMTVYYGSLKPSNYVPAGETRGVTLIEYVAGEDAQAAIQTVAVNFDPTQPATFQLRWVHAGQTYTSTQLSTSSSASQVRSALLNASATGNQKLGDIAGLDLRVSSTSTGSWRISFDGALVGTDVNLIQVINLSHATSPDVSLRSIQTAFLRSEIQQVTLGASTGLYQVQLGTAGTLSTSFAASSTAAQLQALLERLPEIGVGNVLVSGEPQRWTIEFRGRLSGQDLPLLVFNPVQELSVTPRQIGVGETVSHQIQLRFADQTQFSTAVDIAGMSLAEAAQALTQAIERLEGVGVGQVQVSAASTASGEPQRWEVVFKGALAGKTLEALVLQSTLSVTTGGQTQVTTSTVEAKAVRASLIQVASGEHQLRNGLTWGTLNFRPVNVDDFTFFAILPSAGVLVTTLQDCNAATQTSEVQRLAILGAAAPEAGKSSTYVLTFSHEGKTARTAAIAANADAASVQAALNQALATAGIDGSISVALDNPLQSNVFVVTFGGALGNRDLAEIDAEFMSLRAAPSAEALAYSLQKGSPATSESVARNEVQRLVFNNVSAGLYGLALRIDGNFYGIPEPLDVLPSSEDLRTELLKLGFEDLFLEGISEHQQRALLIEHALTQALTVGPRAIAGALVTVTAVPGGSDNSFNYDITFSGSLAGKSIPTLLVFADGLQGLEASSSFANGSQGLGFSATGQEAITQVGPKFNTLEDFAKVLQQAINELLPTGETFSVTARFDPIAKDFLFDLRLTPALPTLELPLYLDFAALDPLASFQGQGVLGLDAGIDFITTIGIDFSRPNDFTVQGGLVLAADLLGHSATGVAADFAGKLLQDASKPFDPNTHIEGQINPNFNPALAASLEFMLDGRTYRVDISAEAQADSQSLADLAAVINLAMADIHLVSSSQLTRLGYDTLGEVVVAQVMHDALGQTQLGFRIYGSNALDNVSVSVRSLEVEGRNAFATQLGLVSSSAEIAAQRQVLPDSIILSQGSAFDLYIDGSDHKITLALAAGTYTPAQLAQALNSAFTATTEIGHLSSKVSNLGQALEAVVTTLPDGAQVISLNTLGQHIVTLEMRALQTDPMVRLLGFLSGDLQKASGVHLFLQDTLLGGKIQAGVKQFSATAELGFIELVMDSMTALIDAGIRVELLDGPEGMPGGRIYLDQLINAATLNDRLLGLRGEVVLNAGQTQTLIAAPRGPEPGVLSEDVGLKLTLVDPELNAGRAMVLDVTLLAETTRNNTSVADLATDLNAAISAAITAWGSANPGKLTSQQLNALKNHTFVSADDLLLFNVETRQQQTLAAAALKFSATASASMKVEGRRLLSNYLSPITFSDSHYTRNSQPLASLIIDGISIDAGGLSLLPPGVDPRIELTLPLLDVWQQGLSLAEALDVRVLGADLLTGFSNLSWSQIVQGMRMVSNLLGQLDSFSFLNQSIPIIDLSVNDIFDIAADLANAMDLLEQNPAAGVGELQQVLANSFGLPIYDASRPEVWGVSMEFDARSNAIAINIPYQIQLLDQSYPISIDLRTLGELIGGNALASVMGPVTSIVDVGGSALVRLQSTAMINLALGIDLASGSLFMFDFNDGGTPDDYSDDQGTFARLGLNVNGTDLAFNASLGPFSLNVKDGLASIQAQAGLFLQDAPSGDASHGDGRHYLSSAIAIQTLREGDSVALIWNDTPNTSDFTLQGQGREQDPWILVANTDSSFRLRLTLGGEVYVTQSLSRDFDAEALQAYLEQALFFGSQALRGQVTVQAVDENQPEQGWTIQLSGPGFDGKTLVLDVQQLRSLAEGGPLGAVNALQWVKIPSGSGGSFTLTASIEGKRYTTAAISRDASAIQVQNALQAALAPIGSGLVQVSLHNAARPQEGWNIEFIGTLAGRPIDLLRADSSQLTHVGSVAVVPVVVSNSPGVVNQTRIAVVAANSGTFNLSFTYGNTTKTAHNLAWNISAEQLQTALNAAMGAGYSEIQVVEDRDSGGFLIRFDGSALKGKAVTVSVETTQLQASPLGALFRDLEVIFDGTANVLLPGYVTLPGEIFSLANAAGFLAEGASNPIFVGNLEVQVTSLSQLMADLIAGRSSSAQEILQSGQYDNSFTINYALPELGRMFDAFALGNPLIRLIRDPSIIIDGIDYALKGIQASLNAIASLPLPLLGDQLAKGAQFIADFRSSVIAQIQNFVSNSLDEFGGMENALRMVLFDALTQDTNGDGLINPVSLDTWIAYEIAGTATNERSGDNPFLNYLKDYNGDHFITADDIVVEFLALGLAGIQDGTRLGYTVAGRTDRKFEDGTQGGDLIDVLEGYSALQQAKALQFRMNLGQDLLSRDLDLSFDIGLPGLNLAVDGGIALDLGWDFFFGFGVNTQEGLYLISQMPGNAGLNDADRLASEIENGLIQLAEGQTYTQENNPEILNPWDLSASDAEVVKEISIKFEAYLAPNAQGQASSATANIFFLQGKLTDDWRTSIVDQSGNQIDHYDPFGLGEKGARTFFRGEFTIDMTDPNNDGRLTWNEMTRGKFSDHFVSSVTGAAQANFRMDLSIADVKVLPRMVADFHLTWALNEASIPQGYAHTFSVSPQVWITDLGIDVGSFFSDFLGPIVGEIQKVTKPLQPIIDGLTLAIPGLSQLAGRDYTILDLAEDLGRGKVNTQFIKSFVYMLDLFNSIPTDAQGLIIPIGRVFTFGGDLRDPNSRKNATLEGSVSDPSAAMSGTPMVDPATGAAGGSSAGTVGFLDKLRNPNNAFQIPILTDFTLILDMIMGKPVDLVTFTPPNLSVSARIDLGTVIYSFPTVKAGIRGGIDIDVALTLGFDTYGLIRFFDSGNPLHILDGFYVSDNLVNGVDMPEIVLNAFLEIYAELNAVILRAGAAGGIKLTGTLDFWDEEGPGANDGKFRASEILNQLLCEPFNPLNLVEANIRGSVYARIYVDLNTFLFGWKNVYKTTLFDLKLFEIVWQPKPCMPILASDDNGDGTLVLHMGNKALLPSNDAVDFDIASLITKDAADRKYRNTEDADEKFVLREIGNGEVEITATLNGVEYTVVYTGVKRIVGFTGRGNDVIDASGLKNIDVVLVAGEGNNTLIGGEKNDVLIGGSGTTLLDGRQGNDLLIARAGTTEMQGGDGTDSFRFIGNWGQARISDNLANATPDVFDFSAQTANLLIDTHTRVVSQGTNQASWAVNTQIGLFAGGSGQDTLDMSFEAARLHIHVADISESWNQLRAGLHQSAQERLLDTDSAQVNDGIVTGSTTGQFHSENNFGDRLFRFTGIENLIGGTNSDVFEFQNLAAISGSLYGGPSVGVGVNSSLERAQVRNILDFSAYNAGVRINTSGALYTLPEGFSTVAGDVTLAVSSYLTAEASAVTIRGFHTIFGSRGDDVIVGDQRVNMLFGMEGNDTLISTSAGDLLVADSIQILDGNKELRRLSLTQAAWQQLPTREWLWYGESIQNFAMGDFQGAQVLIGGSGDDVLMGSAGDDAFHTGGGNVTLVGDFARLRFEADGRLISGEVDRQWRDFRGGHDRIVGLDGDHLVIGGHGSDTITLGNGDNLILGDVGRFELNSLTRRAWMVETWSSGEGAADSIHVGQGSNLILGGAGGDTILAQDVEGSRNIIIGDHGRVTFSLAQVQDHRLLRIESQHQVTSGGDNQITLGLGDAVVIGGRGDDRIIIAAGQTSGGHSTRLIAGDHALIEFDTFGLMTRFVSVDTSPATGGNDLIQIGSGLDLAGRNLGQNFILGGMGSDRILIGAHFNASQQLIRAESTSEDVIIGDNGEILRTASTSTRPNLMLNVRSIEDDKGGDDLIHLANGSKVILGGLGADTINALDGIHLVFGDNAELIYDQVAANGVLRSALTTSTVLGGADLITLREGYKLVAGGIGGDTLRINATGTPEAQGPGWSSAGSEGEYLAGSSYLLGVTGIAAVIPGSSSSALTESRGRSGRFIAGDNARFTFDSRGGLTHLVTLDQIAATGGTDTLIIGAENTTADLGLNVLFGGMAADTIRVQPGSYAETIIFGDNGEFNRLAQSYQLQSLLSTVTNSGGNNQIQTGSGDHIIIGGFGADSINIQSSNTWGKAAGDDESYQVLNRSLVLGDSGSLLFSGGGLQRIESVNFTAGGNDQVVVGDGDVIFVGGYGSDSLNVNSNTTAFRIAAGDNARLLFDPTVQVANQAASLIQITTLDQVSATGGNDTLNFGVAGATSGDMGEILALGGVGSDLIRVSGALARVTLLGDNGEVRRQSGSTGQRIAVSSQDFTLGAGGSITTVAGDYVILGGSGADTIRAGQGQGIVFGDHGSIQFNENGRVSLASSVGTTQGGDDLIELGIGASSLADGDKLVIGGYGADIITLFAEAGRQDAIRERNIAGDNAILSFDSEGRLLTFLSLDSDLSTGGNDRITLNLSGEPDAQDQIHDYQVISGGMGNATISIQSSVRTSDVISGDNLDYRRLVNALGERHHLFAGVVQPSAGGNDTIITGRGDKLLFGGRGSDSITANTGAEDLSIVFGDAGNAVFETYTTDDGVQATRLQQLLSTATHEGAADSLTLGGGSLYLFGGSGGDTLRVNATDAALRLIAGDHAQINFTLGVPMLMQSSGSGSALPGTADNRFILPDSGSNFVIGGPGIDSLIGSQGVQHRLLPGTGSINLATKVVSVVVLGEDGEMGIDFSGLYPSGLNDELLIPGSSLVRRAGEGENPDDPDDSGDPSEYTYFGEGSVIEDVKNQVTGRIAYPALEGGFATFNPASNSRQGQYGYLTLAENGGWRYDLGYDALGLNELINARVQALKDGDIRTEYFTVTTTDGSTTTITVRVEGRTDTPQAVDGVQMIEDVAPYLISGQLNDPVDTQARSRFLAQQTDSAYGRLTLSAEGAWSYELFNAALAVQSLAQGQVERDRFVIQTLDGATTFLEVMITGSNDPAQITGTPVSVQVLEDANNPDLVLTAQGQLQVLDLDQGESFFKSDVTVMPGALGSLTITPQGQWLYQVRNGDLQYLRAGETREEIFTVTSVDGTAQQTLTLTLVGVNNLPQVSGPFSAEVVEKLRLSANGQLQIVDADRDQSYFQATTQITAFGRFTLNESGFWNYQLNTESEALRKLNRDEIQLERFQLLAADGTPFMLEVRVRGESGLREATLAAEVSRPSLVSTDPFTSNLSVQQSTQVILSSLSATAIFSEQGEGSALNQVVTISLQTLGQQLFVQAPAQISPLSRPAIPSPTEASSLLNQGMAMRSDSVSASNPTPAESESATDSTDSRQAENETSEAAGEGESLAEDLRVTGDAATRDEVPEIAPQEGETEANPEEEAEEESEEAEAEAAAVLTSGSLAASASALALVKRAPGKIRWNWN